MSTGDGFLDMLIFLAILLPVLWVLRRVGWIPDDPERADR